MKKIYALILSACALMMVSCGNKADKTLDTLESLKKEAIELQEKITNGETDGRQELEELTTKANELREELTSLEDEMTDEQKQRLANILMDF